MHSARHGSATPWRPLQMSLILLNLASRPPGFATHRGFNHNHGVKTVLGRASRRAAPLATLVLREA